MEDVRRLSFAPTPPQHLGSISDEASAPSGADAANVVYRQVLARLEGRVSAFVLNGFLEPLTAVEAPAGGLRLIAQSAFLRDWVKDHYSDALREEAEAVMGPGVQIEVLHDPSVPPPPPKNVPTVDEPVAPLASVVPLRPRPVAPKGGSTLNRRYSFETFVCGPSNRMAYSACMAVAEAPAQQYSPLFLFGKTGLGKTHLLQAIGNAAQTHHPSLRVIYMSAEQWVNEWIQGIRTQTPDDFRKRYRGGCDLLLIDDIQFLAGKDSSQDEFFHTFNAFHEARKQIVVTSDRYPHEIDGLTHRLQTRLAWGLIADIQPPEIETRIAILHQKAEELGCCLPEDVAQYLAVHVQSSVRALEGALLRLNAYLGVTRTPLTLDAAREYLRPMLARTGALTLDRIAEVVSSYYDLKPEDLRGKSRQRRLTKARQESMYLARKHLQASLPEIGRWFCRDHTTVLSSIRKVEELLRSDAGTQATIARLERDLL